MDAYIYMSSNATLPKQIETTIWQEATKADLGAELEKATAEKGSLTAKIMQHLAILYIEPPRGHCPWSSRWETLPAYPIVGVAVGAVLV